MVIQRNKKYMYWRYNKYWKSFGFGVQKTNGNITKYKNTILSENNLYFPENGWIKIGDISKESYVSDQYLYHW